MKSRIARVKTFAVAVAPTAAGCGSNNINLSTDRTTPREGKIIGDALPPQPPLIVNPRYDGLDNSRWKSRLFSAMPGAIVSPPAAPGGLGIIYGGSLPRLGQLFENTGSLNNYGYHHAKEIFLIAATHGPIPMFRRRCQHMPITRPIAVYNLPLLWFNNGTTLNINAATVHNACKQGNSLAGCLKFQHF